MIVLEIEFALAEMGVASRTASTIAAAVQLIENERFDFALMDYGFVDGDADALARLLIKRSIPFAFCSAHELAREAATLFSVPLLAKPFGTAELAMTLSNGLHIEQVS